MFKSKKPVAVLGWFICILGAAFYCYEYFLRIEPSVMVTELMQQFNVTASGFGLITALYYYAYTPMQLAVGILVDRYGTRLMIGVAVMACTLGSFLFSLSYTKELAGVARFLIGFGSAFAFVGVMKLAAEWLPEKYFAMFAGITTSLGMLAGMAGDISLTSLVHEIGWRNTQHLGTIIGGILIPLIFFFIHDTPKSKFLPVHKTNTFANTFSGLRQIVKNPQMWLAGFIGSALYLSLSAFAELWGIKFLQAVYNLSAKQAGIACSMVFIGWLISSPLSGWLSDLIKSRKKPLIFSGFFAAIAMLIIIWHPLPISFGMLLLLLFLFGSFCANEILCFAIGRESNPHKVAGTAVACVNLLVMLGGSIFQPFLGFLLDLGWQGQIVNGARIYTALNYQQAFTIIPIIMLLGSVVAGKLKETLN